MGPPNAEVRETEALRRLYQKADFVFTNLLKIEVEMLESKFPKNS